MAKMKPEDTDYLPAGSRVTAWLLNEIDFRRTIFMGSHCPLLEEILKKVREKAPIKTFYTGSMGGLKSIIEGLADMSGIHLYQKGEYNIPILEELNIKNVILVRGYIREQGFIYRQDIKVKSFKDIIENNLRFINRNPGSGTRNLIEELLKNTARETGESVEKLKEKIIGYNLEARSHEAVAYMIHKGVADVGIGVRYVAEKYNLGFEKITDEIYDILIHKGSLNQLAVKQVLEILNSPSFRQIIKSFPGYKIHEKTGKIIFES